MDMATDLHIHSHHLHLLCSTLIDFYTPTPSTLSIFSSHKFPFTTPFFSIVKILCAVIHSLKHTHTKIIEKKKMFKKIYIKLTKKAKKATNFAFQKTLYV